MNFMTLQRDIISLALAGRNSLQISAHLGINHEELKTYLEVFFQTMPIEVDASGYKFGILNYLGKEIKHEAS